MPLLLSRRAGESFSIYDRFGFRRVRVTVVRGGSEPLLEIECPRHLIIRRDDDQPPPAAHAAAA